MRLSITIAARTIDLDRATNVVDELAWRQFGWLDLAHLEPPRVQVRPQVHAQGSGAREERAEFLVEHENGRRVAALQRRQKTPGRRWRSCPTPVGPINSVLVPGTSPPPSKCPVRSCLC